MLSSLSPSSVPRADSLCCLCGVQILPFAVTPGNGWVLARTSFVAGSSNVRVGARCAGCAICCCAGEGPLLTHITAANDVADEAAINGLTAEQIAAADRELTDDMAHDAKPLTARTIDTGSARTTETGAGAVDDSKNPLISSTPTPTAGVFFAGRFGGIERHVLGPGQSLSVEPGHFFAAHERTPIGIGLAGGCATCLCGSERFVLKFRGPAIVYTKTRNPRIFKRGGPCADYCCCDCDCCDCLTDLCSCGDDGTHRANDGVDWGAGAMVR
jgi:hypothetical protein